MGNEQNAIRQESVDMGAQVPMAMTRGEYLAGQAEDTTRTEEGVLYVNVDGVSLRLVLGGKSDQEDTAATRPLGNENWRADRACIDTDPDIFILETVPKKAEKEERAMIKAENKERLSLARRICATCVVHDDCLEAAMKKPNVGGIQAGLTERERLRLRRA